MTPANVAYRKKMRNGFSMGDPETYRATNDFTPGRDDLGLRVPGNLGGGAPPHLPAGEKYLKPFSLEGAFIDPKNRKNLGIPSCNLLIDGLTQ